jgi:hypothetical protein
MCDIRSGHPSREAATMQTIQIRTQAGEDGVLHLNIPVGTPNAEYQVVLVLQSTTDTPAPKSPEELGWPPHFFEETAGAIEDPTFRRHEQGEFEKRLDFE